MDRLSDRQKACLRLVHSGFVAKEIARRLDVSPNAVNERLRAARRILGVGTSREAARALAAYEQRDHYNQTVDEPFVMADVADQTIMARSITPGSASVSDDVTLSQEERPSHLSDASQGRLGIVWPFPVTGRPHNDLTIRQTTITVLGLAIGLGLIALVAITLVDQLSRLRLS